MAERLNGSRPVTAHPERDRASHRTDGPAEAEQTPSATPDVATVVEPLLEQFFAGGAPSGSRSGTAAPPGRRALLVAYWSTPPRL